MMEHQFVCHYRRRTEARKHWPLALAFPSETRLKDNKSLTKAGTQKMSDNLLQIAHKAESKGCYTRVRLFMRRVATCLTMRQDTSKTPFGR